MTFPDTESFSRIVSNAFSTIIVGKDDAKIESNVIDFAIVTKPYVKELYTGDSAVVREGEEYDLTK